MVLRQLQKSSLHSRTRRGFDGVKTGLLRRAGAVQSAPLELRDKECLLNGGIEAFDQFIRAAILA